MATPAKHALLSASAAHRWLKCTAAPTYEMQFPPKTSEYAEEGTLAHSICELYARKKFTVMSTRKFNSELKKAARTSALQARNADYLRVIRPVSVRGLHEIRGDAARQHGSPS